MTQRVWKFIAAATTEMATPVYNSLIQAGDRFEQAIAKLQSLLSVRNLRTVLTAPVSVGASSIVDLTIITLPVAANRAQVGDVYDIELRGLWTKPNSAGTTIQFWVKVDTVKVVTLTYTPGAAITNLPFVMRARVTVRSIGAAGVLAGAGDMTLATSATAVAYVIAGGATDTQNTTAAFNITAGIVFSNSNASNNVTANVGYIRQG